MAGEKMNGVMFKVMPLKGYGFIRGEDGFERFVHCSAFGNVPWDTIHEGMKVRFEPTVGPKGPRAEQVEVIK